MIDKVSRSASRDETRPILTGILLALAGFAFLYPGFDGTLRGLLTAFFWGYASDFSAEAITQAAKQK